MRNFQSRIAAVLTFLLIQSCSFFIFPDFKIIDFSYTDDYLKIDFSDEVELSSFENSFVFTKDNTPIYGTFKKEENSVLFYPDDKINENHEYHFIIYDNVENLNGTSLTELYEKSFNTKKIDTPLKILNHTITENQIQIIFSKPVNTKNITANIKITPATDFYITCDQNTDYINIVFPKNFANNTRYFISISNFITDIYNNRLEKDYDFSFIYKEDNSKTDFFVQAETLNGKFIDLTSETTNENIPNNSSFRFTFSKEINLSTINSSVTVIPDTEFKIIKDEITKKSFSLVLSNKPEFNSSLQIKTMETMSDINNNNIQPATFTIKFNNEKEKPLEFISGVIDTGFELIHFDDENNFNYILLPSDKFPVIKTDISNYLNVYLLFDCTLNCTLDFRSIVENIYFSKTNNCIDLTPLEYSILQFEILPSAIKNILTDKDFSSKNLQVIKCKIAIQNKSSQGLIKLNLDKSLKDTFNNTLIEEKTFIFNKQ